MNPFTLHVNFGKAGIGWLVDKIQTISTAVHPRQSNYWNKLLARP